MNETAFETIAQAAAVLKLDFSSEEFAGFAEDHALSEEAIEVVRSVFSYLREKKQQTTVLTLLKMSRLPTKEPKTFDNFDFSLLKGKDVDRLKALPSLAAIYSHRNLAFIGPAGTGKTHLAQAFGYACCQHGMKTYFIKASELRDRFTMARRSGKTDSCLCGLVRPSCLIVDEIGHCAFDRENTRLFFDLIDRRYNKEGNLNMIFTSNKNPALWREDFDEDATLLCALDRIFDDATVFKLRGESFRGKKLETVSLQTGKVKAVEPPNAPGEQKLNLTIWAVWSFLLGRFWRFQLSPNWSFLPDANNSVEGTVHVGCWAHVRRKFKDALKVSGKGKKSPTAAQGVAYCTQLFKLEEQWKDLTTGERQKKRSEQAKPVLDAILAWSKTRTAAPKSKLGIALNYLKNQWPTLTTYLQDGRIELSNNRAERSIKPFVISRKNFLFANTTNGAQSCAVLFSLIETAKENNLDPCRYLTWILKEAPKRSCSDPDWARTLIPQNAPPDCR